MTIKNIPAPLYAALKQRAASNRRSLNGEVIMCLEQALLRRSVAAREELLARIDERRATLKTPFVTQEELQAMKEAGRL